MVRKQRRYGRDFKLEAVRLASEEGRRVRDVAESMGVEVKLLYRWVKQHDLSSSDAFPGSGNVKPSEAEVVRLRREVAALEEERDILKKAAVFMTERS